MKNAKRGPDANTPNARVSGSKKKARVDEGRGAKKTGAKKRREMDGGGENDTNHARTGGANVNHATTINNASKHDHSSNPVLCGTLVWVDASHQLGDGDCDAINPERNGLLGRILEYEPAGAADFEDASAVFVIFPSNYYWNADIPEQYVDACPKWFYKNETPMTPFNKVTT